MDRDLSVNSVITDTVSNDLIKVLGLDDYMGFSDSCSMTSPGYNSTTDGWFNGMYFIVYFMSVNSVITDIVSNDLIKVLGLDDYMGFSDSCSMTSPGYSSATDGWFNGRYFKCLLYG